MMRTRRRDTPAELRLRSALHRRGLRFRVDCAPISGARSRADVVFSSAKVAVFVDGCFWHGCPVHGTSPKANAEWWEAKIDGNRLRDRDTDRRLREAGWQVVRIWEHEDLEVAVARVSEAL
jgi:DNA mismatch endonuclease, patch repair protein